MQQALFGGSCFGASKPFLQIRGVEKVTSGYAGGHTTHPTYEQVCQGDTQHAEVVLIDFDEQQVTYSQLLDVFFATHDPTTLNRKVMILVLNTALLFTILMKSKAGSRTHHSDIKR